MEMTLRWYGSSYDSVTLKQIRQIPGVSGVISTLYGKKAGEVWELSEIKTLKDEIEQAGLKLLGIESVNIHDAIKIGLPIRDLYIDNYIRTLESLGLLGINMVCYNFMPVFDWTRTELSRIRKDGSTVLAYNQDEINKIKPEEMFETLNNNSNGFIMPGWEPNRLSKLKELFNLYKNVTEEDLFNNLVYFLNKIKPVCEKYNIKMAIHPDDPAWPIFNLPRIITGKDKILRLLKAVDSPFNGITFCTGSLGTNPDNNLVDMISSFKDRIHFVHLRNLKYNSPIDFEEAAHLSSDGSLDMYKIMKALVDINYKGPIRPDHGRMIWNEVAMPGYGLYDRALGTQYLLGLLEAITKGNC